MTAETERRVPEHPGWQPWWVRVAEFDGHRLLLIDRHRFPESACHTFVNRFLVGELEGLRPCPLGVLDCGFKDQHEYGPIKMATDSLTEAEAAFAEACERLREGG